MARKVNRPPFKDQLKNYDGGSSRLPAEAAKPKEPTLKEMLEYHRRHN